MLSSFHNWIREWGGGFLKKGPGKGEKGDDLSDTFRPENMGNLREAWDAHGVSLFPAKVKRSGDGCRFILLVGGAMGAVDGGSWAILVEGGRGVGSRQAGSGGRGSRVSVSGRCRRVGRGGGWRGGGPGEFFPGRAGWYLLLMGGGAEGGRALVVAATPREAVGGGLPLLGKGGGSSK